MHFDFPDCKRCCFCLPLRRGIITFGYLNLVWCLFILALDMTFNMRPERSPQRNHMFAFRGVGIYAAIWLFYLLYILDVVFNAMLLVGLHKKIDGPIRWYYYYGMVTTLAMFINFFVVRWYNQYGEWYLFDQFELTLAVSGLALQCYLLFLIRSELKKNRYQTSQIQYVNHLHEVMVDSLPPGGGRNLN